MIKLSVHILLVIIMTLCLVMLIVMFFLNQLLYPNMYVSSLKQAGAFDYAEPQLAQSGPTSFIKIPEGGVEVLMKDFMTNLLSYLRSNTDMLNLTVQLDKQKLRSFFLSQMQNVSICSRGEQPDYDDLENLCRPSNISTDRFLDEFLTMKNLTFFQSDTVDLVPVYGLEEGSEGRERLEKVRGYVRYARYGMIFLVLFILGLVALNFRLERRNRGSFMRWTGSSFILAGAIVISLIGLAVSRMKSITPPSEFPLLAGLGNTIVNVVTSKFYLFAGIALVIGLGLFVGSFFFRANKLKQK